MFNDPDATIEPQWADVRDAVANDTSPDRYFVHFSAKFKRELFAAIFLAGCQARGCKDGSDASRSHQLDGSIRAAERLLAALEAVELKEDEEG